MKKQKIIPIFYAVDGNYTDYLIVSLTSLKENASKDYFYKVYILNSDIEKTEGVDRVKSEATDNLSIEFVDVSEPLSRLASKLQLRDYYTLTTYYRIFIADMFPEYDKALYLDSDTVILGDISELYNYDLKDNLVGAIPDGIVKIGGQVFIDYVEKVLGIKANRYFNAGILSMNLKKFREFGFYSKFVDLIARYKFVVAQDQDYLNVICKDKVLYISATWDAMPMGNYLEKAQPKLIHYNLTAKPWKSDDILYSEYFWVYAEKSGFTEHFKEKKNAYTIEDVNADKACEDGLKALCLQEVNNPQNYYNLYIKNKEYENCEEDVFSKLFLKVAEN